MLMQEIALNILNKRLSSIAALLLAIAETRIC
jgi:hypothetical protein